MKKFCLVHRLVFLIILFSNGLVNGQDNDYVLERLPSQGRVIFLGNSITYAGQFVNQFITASLLGEKDQNLEFFNLGLPSETVSGLSEEGHAGGAFPRPYLHDRLNRVIKSLKPDVVIACYGMNDGIYLPFDQDRFEYYAKGMERLHRELSDFGTRIVFLTPPVYDPIHDESYAEVLHYYTDWLIRQREEKDWEVIDVHWPMYEFLRINRIADTSFFLAKDGIHPNEIGHWQMAKSLIEAFCIQNAPLPQDPDVFFRSYPNGIEILRICSEMINLSRDYWLHEIGHKRPGLNPPLSKKDFQREYEGLNRRLKEKLVHALATPP